MRLVPAHVSIYCLVDGWSTYEREELWRTEYEVVLRELLDAAQKPDLDCSNNFKLLLTSPTMCRWLDNFVMPGQRVSLRNRDANDGNWRGSSRASLSGLARASTMSDINSS